MSKDEDNASDDSASVAKRIVETILREGHLPAERSESHPAIKISTGPLITAQVGQAIILINDPEKLAEFLLQKIKERAGSNEWAIHVSDDEQLFQSEMLTKRSIETLATTAMVFFINNLAEKLTEMLNEHIEESLMLLRRGQEKLFVEGMAKTEPELHFEICESATKSVEMVIKRTTEARKARLLRPLMLINQIGEPRWCKMRAHYSEILPLIKEARKVYEGNSTRDWRAMIQAGFPILDNDIITLLSEDTNALALLPSDVTDRYSDPSDIALEQAARICGMRPFKLGPDRIRKLMDKHDPVNPVSKASSLKTTKPVKPRSKRSSLKKRVTVKPRQRTGLTKKQ